MSISEVLLREFDEEMKKRGHILERFLPSPISPHTRSPCRWAVSERTAGAGHIRTIRR